MPTPPRRRWFRFSLRTLLLLVAIVAVGFGWLGVKIRQAHEQRDAVAAIVKLNGIVCYDYEPGPSYGYQQPAIPPGPTWLRNLLGVDFLAHADQVWLDGSFPVDELSRLHSLPGVRFLSISNPQNADGVLDSLAGLTQLKELNVCGMHVTDGSLVYLARLTQLKQLNLVDTQVTDERYDDLRRALPNVEIRR
jgi:hypothetical protein